ncbi:MAG: DUF3352 domain-containing protein [Planctomycetia bacterium]|nr:DUF3352 domain-containing protein [Planctomycetia bacterium]
MSRTHWLTGLTCCLLLVGSADLRAETTPDPLRLVPAQADIAIQLERPRALAETTLALDLVKQLQAFEPIREFYDSTNFRRFQQLLGYFEKELGAKWPDLLDRLAGGGIVLAAKFGEEPAPALLVMQSKDEAALKQFVKLVRGLLDQELPRDDAKQRLEVSSYQTIETLRIGQDFHAAVAGSALLLANRQKALHAALDCHLANGKQSLAGVEKINTARRQLPAERYGWLWLDLEHLRELPGYKQALAGDATDPLQLILFGGWLDLIRHAPYVTAALTPEGAGLSLSVRSPRGQAEMPAALSAMHLPAARDGSLPLLEPKGVLFSTSYVLDLAQFWEQRAKLLNAKQVQDLEEGEKQAAKVLAGIKLGKILSQAGPHQRFVAVHQPKAGYQTQPGTNIPAIAFVQSMRDPYGFARSLETIIRAGVLASRGQTGLKLAEEKHGDLKLVGFRFPEDKPYEGDTNNLRFNFSPCFVAVGDQFVMASTIELGRELIGVLQQEAKAPAPRSPAASRLRFYAAGGADYLQSIEEQLLAATILDQALAPKEAQEQVRKLIDLVRRAGALSLDNTYEAKQFRFDIKYAK